MIFCLFFWLDWFVLILPQDGAIKCKANTDNNRGDTDNDLMTEWCDYPTGCLMWCLKMYKKWFSTQCSCLAPDKLKRWTLIQHNAIWIKKKLKQTSLCVVLLQAVKSPRVTNTSINLMELRCFFIWSIYKTKCEYKIYLYITFGQYVCVALLKKWWVIGAHLSNMIKSCSLV